MLSRFHAVETDLYISHPHVRQPVHHFFGEKGTVSSQGDMQPQPCSPGRNWPEVLRQERFSPGKGEQGNVVARDVIHDPELASE